MKLTVTPTTNRRNLGAEDFIVSKTDTRGRITYANRIFMEICGFPESDLLNVQHNIIRHPDMPRGVFRFMWDTLKAGDEFLGFAKNLCSDGSYYSILLQTMIKMANCRAIIQLDDNRLSQHLIF
jgi:PAS domain-containing protein